MTRHPAVLKLMKRQGVILKAARGPWFLAKSSPDDELQSCKNLLGSRADMVVKN